MNELDTEFGNQMMKYLAAIQCIVMEPISLFFVYVQENNPGHNADRQGKVAE